MLTVSVCTTPIRPTPTNFPPFGSMAVIQSLRTIGIDSDFYDIDFHRYSEQQVESYFLKNQFDVVGISAVVSTAYENTKRISNTIRRVSPSTLVVLGGNLGASAELVLRKTEIDVCVIGDGELTFKEVVSRLSNIPRNRLRENIHQSLIGVEGLAYLNDNDEFIFSGFRKAPSEEDILTPDFSILEKSNSLDHFVYNVQDRDVLELLRIRFPELVFPKETTVFAAKGCVARCTFCHRWERGYRVRPLDQLIDHIQHLYSNYGVRSLSFGDENFGSNQEITRELVSFLGQLGISWEVAGVRARTVSPEEFEFWKKNGCRRAIYGIESGSETILRVMQKGTTVEQNTSAMNWIKEAGLDTTLQLVIGMPGETDSTISETISFAKNIVDSYCRKGSLPSLNCSINYAQALPGTPLYEYARQYGWLGETLDSEELYLEKISDLDAYSNDHFLNYTGLPLLKVLMWRYRILGEVDAFYLENRLGVRLTLWQTIQSSMYGFAMGVKFVTGWNFKIRFGSPLLQQVESKITENGVDESGYFNIQKGSQFSLLYLARINLISYPLLAIFVAINNQKSLSNTFKLLIEHLWWSSTKRLVKKKLTPTVTLRKLIDVRETSSKFEGSAEMVAIRNGR